MDAITLDPGQIAIDVEEDELVSLPTQNIEEQQKLHDEERCIMTMLMTNVILVLFGVIAVAIAVNSLGSTVPSSSAATATVPANSAPKLSTFSNPATTLPEKSSVNPVPRPAIIRGITQNFRKIRQKQMEIFLKNDFQG